MDKKIMVDIDTSSKESRALFYNSMEWREKRQEIINRDNHECQWCKEDGKVTTICDSNLEVDHIKELEYYPELALDNDNLRTLCKDCHNKRHNRMNYRRGNPKVYKWQDERWD